MRQSLLIVAALLLAARPLSAQLPSPFRFASGPACDAPQQHCGCATAPRCESPPAAPPAAPQQAPTGYYAAPPQNGVLEGPSSSLEVEGLTLRFPALEFKLPSLRLPTCSTIHKNPRMLISEAHAPYVQQPPVAYGAPIAIQPVQAPPPAAPPQAPPAAPPSCQPPACDAPYGVPRCDAALLNLQEQLRLRDQKIAQLDQQIGRMANSMERLAQVVERMTPAAAAAAPPPSDLIVREPRPMPAQAAAYSAAPLPQPRLRLQQPPQSMVERAGFAQ